MMVLAGDWYGHYYERSCSGRVAIRVPSLSRERLWAIFSATLNPYFTDHCHMVAHWNCTEDTRKLWSHWITPSLSHRDAHKGCNPTLHKQHSHWGKQQRRKLITGNQSRPRNLHDWRSCKEDGETPTHEGELCAWTHHARLLVSGWMVVRQD